MKKKILIALSFLMILSGCGKVEDNTAKVEDGIATEATTEELKYYYGERYFYNLKYGDRADNTFDLYLPDEVCLNDSHGVFLVIHGGSFQRGDKRDMIGICTTLRNDGYIVVNMNYSLMTEESFDVNSFTMLDDITTCIQTVNDTLEKFEIKTDSLALCGYSAGGNLAMLYSYSKFNESAIPIKFVVDMVGPTDYHKSTWGFEEGITSEIGDEDYLNYAISHLSGKSLNDISAEEKEKIVNSISPVYFVNSSSVPSILAYGDSDTIVGIKQQDPLINKLNETGAKYDYILFDNCGHILTDNNTKYEELHQLILKYAEEYF